MNNTEPRIQIETSRDFSEIYPGASVGILVLENVTIQPKASNLGDAKREIINGLRKQFPDQNSLKEHQVIQAYSRYYKKFDKSYHVLGQLRSMIFEDRPLPFISPLIEAIFAAELKNMLLTAFHDLDTLIFPLKIRISAGDETYITLAGEEKRLKPADMMISDQRGIISSVIYGPDKQTRVTPSTSRVLVAVYAPEGINREKIISHFEDLEKLVRLVSPSCRMTTQTLLPIS